MTIDTDIPRATLMAYADGELNESEARQVAAALNADAALAAQVDAHRALRREVSAAYASVAQEPVRDRLKTILDRMGTQPTPTAQPRIPRPRQYWASGLVGVVALALGLTIGRALPLQQLDSGPSLDGATVRALDTQLSTAQAADSPVRIGITYRATSGELCRTFAQPTATGIACRDGGGWSLRHWAASSRENASDRQTSATAIAGIADSMMAGTPLDPVQESEALAADWR